MRRHTLFSCRAAKATLAVYYCYYSTFLKLCRRGNRTMVPQLPHLVTWVREETVPTALAALGAVVRRPHHPGTNLSLRTVTAVTTQHASQRCQCWASVRQHSPLGVLQAPSRNATFPPLCSVVLMPVFTGVDGEEWLPVLLPDSKWSSVWLPGASMMPPTGEAGWRGAGEVAASGRRTESERGKPVGSEP